MKRIVRRRFHGTQNRLAFAFIELVLVITILGMLVALHLPFYSRLRERTHITIDQNNLRQILQASAFYAAENDERLAHPTWGGDLTGPDGWAYLTSRASRGVPGSIQFTPGSCAGRDADSPQFTNQLAFFKVGQVTQYLPDVKAAWCPKDVATRRSGTLRSLWLGRPVKVTSYTWSATVGGLVGPISSRPPIGRTHKISDFLPTDWQTWEANESNPFLFNDAANDPSSPSDCPSLRHTGMQRWWQVSVPVGPRALSGGAMVGQFGGSAELIRWPRVYDLFSQKVLPPNDILNGPGYR